MFSCLLAFLLMAIIPIVAFFLGLIISLIFEFFYFLGGILDRILNSDMYL